MHIKKILSTAAAMLLIAVSSFAGDILVQGGPIHGANGIAFNKEDKLYVASINGSEILVLQEQPGKIEWKIADIIGYKDGIKGPDDLAFAADGSFYAVMPFLGLVGHYTADGKLLGSQFVGRGVNPVAISPEGRLFVGLSFFNDALYEVDPALKNPPRLLGKNFGFLNAMMWHDGYLYAPAMIPGKILKIDVDTDPITISTVTEGLNNPSALKFNLKGELFVTDKKSGDVWKVDPVTGEKQVVVKFKPGVLDNLAFDSKDRLFISSSTEGWIAHVIFRDNYKKAKVVQIDRGGLILPAGVAVAVDEKGKDHVFVADMTTLRQFDGDSGKKIDADLFCIVGAFSSDYKGITHNITVSASSFDKVVVSSWVSGEVQVWNPLTKTSIEVNHFKAPMNAAFYQNDLVVADFSTKSVVRKTSGGLQTVLGNLAVPAGLASYGNTLWVGDWATGMIWQVIDNGSGSYSSAPVVKGLHHPEGIARDINGDLLVVESGLGRVIRVNLKTGVINTVKDNLEFGADPYHYPHTPPIYAFKGIAVGGKGDIYVSGHNDKGRCLYKFRRITGIN